MKFAMGNADHTGDIAVQVQQGVQFDGAFALSEFGHWEKRQAKIDQCGIQGVDVCCRSTPMGSFGIQRSGCGDEHLGEIGIDAPISHLVGIGQGVARDLAAKTHVVKLGLGHAQADLDVPQAFAKSQLGEGHS